MSDDEILQQCINGSSVRAIARTRDCAVSEVNAVIDRFAEATIDDKTRKHSLAVELARLDQLQETFYAQALDGDVASGALCAKIIERRCTILGLYTPPATTLQVVEAQAPRETSTEKIRHVLDQLMSKTDRTIEGEVIKEEGDD